MAAPIVLKHTNIALAKSCRRVIIKSYMRYRCEHYSTNSSPQTNILDLKHRGLIEHVFPNTRATELNEVLSSPQGIYCGFDPTADSLHVGNLLSIITLLHAQQAGYSPITIVGGATAFIGDPSGVSKDRVPMTAEQIENNVISITENIKRVTSNYHDYISKNDVKVSPFRILNNRDWYKDQDVISFLSTIGRHFRLGEMVSRHSIQSRLNSKEGISCTEFMYQVFQANDWLHLFQRYQCNLQVGGNDQTGNISSGFDLVHKVTNKYVFGLLVPLMLAPNGMKLGKTTGNCMWLHPNKTSPYELYQYFFNMPDNVVEHYLKVFTFFPLEEIASICEKHQKSPEKRQGQRIIAEQITLLVHGAQGLESAKRCTETLFEGSVTALSEMTQKELEQLFKNAPTTELSVDSSYTVQELSRRIHCFDRDVDAERVIQGGGFYINQKRITDPNALLHREENILSNGITLIRVGKKNYFLIKWTS